MQQPASPFDFTSASYAQQYQSLLVPRLFLPWARRLLESVEFRSGDKLLDVACGPGTVTREAAARGGKGTTGVDSSDQMLDIARVLDERATIVYLHGSADALPVPDGAFDIVTCQQGLQFFENRAAALCEMRRALIPRGRIAIAVWARIEQQPLWSALFRGLEKATAPEIAAGILKPFSYPGATELRDEMVEAGFVNVGVFTDELPIVFEGGAAQAAQVAYATPLAGVIEALGPETRQKLREATMEELRQFDNDGVTQSSCRAYVAIGRR